MTLALFSIITPQTGQVSLVGSIGFGWLTMWGFYLAPAIGTVTFDTGQDFYYKPLPELQWVDIFLGEPMARNNFYQLKDILHLAAQRGEVMQFCQREQTPGDPEYGIPAGEILSCKVVDGWSASNRNVKVPVGPDGVVNPVDPATSLTAYIVKNEKFDIAEFNADSRIKIGEATFQITQRSTPIYRGRAVIYVFGLDATTETSRINR